MEPRSGYFFWQNRPPGPPTIWMLDCLGSWNLLGVLFFQCCAVSPPQLFTPTTRYVRCLPHPGYVISPPQLHPIKKVCAVSRCIFFCAVSPPKVVACLCHTWPCLGFEAKLRICQVPTCKMNSQAFLCVIIHFALSYPQCWIIWQKLNPWI